MLSINTNLSTLIAQNSLKNSTSILNQAVERMTTGYKINHAKDNAANYSIATNMTTKIGSYNVAADNCAMGMDLVTTASDTVSLMQDKAHRLRALATQARNGTYGAQSMAAINAEASAIMSEINRIYSTAEYNGIKLFSEPATTPTTSSVDDTPAVYFLRSAEPMTFAMTRTASEPATSSYEDVEMVALTDEVTAFTSGTVYSIDNVAQLQRLADLVNSEVDSTGATFVLTSDIDLSSIDNWTPIGVGTTKNNKFKGIFDGNGHVITNLTIQNTGESNQGLFGHTTSTSEIKNVGIENGKVRGKNCVGALVGKSESFSISNCYARCEVIAPGSYIGGLVGQASSCSISNCYTTGAVTCGNGYIGGLVGQASSCSISNCYATGNVGGDGYAGGLVGDSYRSSTISNCYATGNVGGASGSNVGGLAGRSADSSISNSYATGNVTARGSNIGGFVGDGSSSSITNCSAIQADVYATVMAEEQIKETYTPESMGFTEANGWTIINGTPLQSYQREAQVRPTPTPTPTPEGGDSPSGGSYGVNAFCLQIGINGDNSCQIGFDINFTYDLSAIEVDIASDEALATIDDFIAQLSEQETKLGAVQNRLESALESISVNIENLTSSLSTIRDADIAEVSSHYIQQQILQQASSTLLATANQSPAIALQLI